MFKLIRIEKFVEKNVRISQGFVGSLCLYRQEKGLDFEKLKVLGVTIKNKRVLDLVSWAELSNMAALCPNLCVVFDHALGGGTETYFKNKVAELKEKYQFLRVQYFRKNEAYLVALLSAESEKSAPAPSFEALSNMLLGGVKPYKIVLNNLVGYQNVEQILLLISKLKNKKIPVEMPGHDYYAVCPFFNLVDHRGKYCDIPDLAVCKTCFSLNKLFKESHQSESWLKAGVQDLAQWRAMWGAFFRQTLDELIVFSESGKTLFTKAYPCLEGKIKIIPHQVPYLRKVDAQKHPQKTIAVLGSINVNKGLNIVKEMNELCKQRDLKILIVGEAKTSELLQTGHYDVQNLPDIMEKNKVDLVFIPSIWPETFSYTTAEAMSMGLPVACFNLGAPAERVLKYDKGLIVSKIDAQTALDEIERFLQKMG